MSFEQPDRKRVNEGNYLRKSKKIFNLSKRGSWLIDRLSYQLCVNRSSVVELAVRKLYQSEIGEVPDLNRDSSYLG